MAYEVIAFLVVVAGGFAVGSMLGAWMARRLERIDSFSRRVDRILDRIL